MVAIRGKSGKAVNLCQFKRILVFIQLNTYSYGMIRLLFALWNQKSLVLILLKNYNNVGIISIKK